MKDIANIYLLFNLFTHTRIKNLQWEMNMQRMN